MENNEMKDFIIREEGGEIVLEKYFGNKKNVVIPEGVTRIGFRAFACLINLSSVMIPEGVNNIGSGAFEDCSSLTTITIPEGVTGIGNGAFYGCSSLESIIIPEGVTRIGYYVFYGCKGLTSITIPNSVTRIYDHAFEGCERLMKKGKFKATNYAMRCRSFQYEIGKSYHEDKAILCESGFHYCTNAFDLFNYYNGEIGKNVRFFKVKTNGTSRKRRGDSKRVCTDIALVEEIKSYAELLN